MEKNHRALLGALVLFSGVATAADTTMRSYETEVLHRGKYARPITDFVNTEGKHVLQQQALQQSEIRRRLDGVVAAANGRNVEGEIMEMMFPVEPELIKRVVLPGTQVLKPLPSLPRPMFIIGNDSFSLQWLEANKYELERFQAAGVLTRVKDKAEFEAIKKLAAPLPLMPMPADALAAEMGVPGYPIMITGQGYFQ